MYPKMTNIWRPGGRRFIQVFAGNLAGREGKINTNTGACELPPSRAPLETSGDSPLKLGQHSDKPNMELINVVKGEVFN